MPFEQGTFIAPHPERDDYHESRINLFRMTWPIADDYQIVDGILRPKPGAGWKDSYPITKEHLPIELAKIAENDHEALLAFTRKYGLLGFTPMLPLSVPAIFARGKPLTVAEILAEPTFLCGDSPKQAAARANKFIQVQLKRLASDKRTTGKLFAECGLPVKHLSSAFIQHGGGDPLLWVWAHIRTLKVCLALTEHIQNQDEEFAFSYLRSFQINCEEIKRELSPTFDVAFLHRISQQTWIKPGNPKGWSTLDFAKYIRRQLINGNIEGFRVALEPVGKRERSFFEYRSMIEVAYWHLRGRVDDGRMRSCRRDKCRSFFVQTDGRQVFCSPTCGNRNRAMLGMRKRRSSGKQPSPKGK